MSEPGPTLNRWVIHAPPPGAGRPRRATPGSSRVLLAALAAALTACAQTPTEAYDEAHIAAEAKELDAFLPHLTERSAKLLRSLEGVRTESAGRLSWLPSPFDIHVFGSVVEEEIFDDTAVLQIEDRGRTERVLMRYEGGLWRIDALELDGFWRPIQR